MERLSTGVTLIDRVNQAGAKAKTATRDHRTTTVHAAGVAMLDALGVWPLIAKMQHQFPVSSRAWPTTP